MTGIAAVDRLSPVFDESCQSWHCNARERRRAREAGGNSNVRECSQ